MKATLKNIKVGTKMLFTDKWGDEQEVIITEICDYGITLEGEVINPCRGKTLKTVNVRTGEETSVKTSDKYKVPYWWSMALEKIGECNIIQN